MSAELAMGLAIVRIAKLETQKKLLVAVLAEMVEHIESEHDITEGGGPNWAMRLTNEFGANYRSALTRGGE